MTALLQIYKCEICGNIVEVIHEGAGKLVCCGKPMNLLEENITDAAEEKHIPLVEKVGDGLFKVTVGSVPHPMVDEHFIQWVQIIAGKKACRAFLNPGDAPEAIFKVETDEVSAREYCNLHGLWKGE
ncbi:MAG: desulfoferrodoxin [candidate division Zixibacteria bacterium]|nr:desulfoferrodoxin [Candidatus Tariuqbacter arcticus]